MAADISRAPILEDPEEFKAWIIDHVTPCGGRELSVEILQGTYDFKSWLPKLDVHIVGLASTRLELMANHVWRIVSRHSMRGMGLGFKTKHDMFIFVSCC